MIFLTYCPSQGPLLAWSNPADLSVSLARIG